jgi:hypothetical protein
MAEKKTTKGKDKNWIKKAIKNPGAFTAKAKRKGITTAQLQANVEKDPEKYDEKTRKQAKLRETLVRINKDKKNKKAKES